MDYKKSILKLIKRKDLTTKVRLYFSSKLAGDDYDKYEANYTTSKLNPLTIKGYVRMIAPETSFWKQYGLAQTDVKEILCETKYKQWFETCEEIEIDSQKYQVFKYGGNKTAIVTRPFNMIRVTVTRKD